MRARSPADLNSRDGEGMGDVTERVGTGGRGAGDEEGERRAEGGRDRDSGEISADGIVLDRRRTSLGGSGGDAFSTGVTMMSVSSAASAFAVGETARGERCGLKKARRREPAVIELTLEADRRRRRRLNPSASMPRGRARTRHSRAAGAEMATVRGRDKPAVGVGSETMGAASPRVRVPRAAVTRGQVWT